MSQNVNNVNEKTTKVSIIKDNVVAHSNCLLSGKSPISNCWAAIVQLKNTNEELANQIKELTTRLEQQKQSAVKVNRERLSEIRKLQKSSAHKGKSHEEQQLEKQITALKEKFMLLNKVKAINKLI